MEQKLKERVVGASLLVLAGVIFIPWLLDGRGHAGNVTQPLELPSPSTTAQTRTIQLNEPEPPEDTGMEREPEPAPKPARQPSPAAQETTRTAPPPAAPRPEPVAPAVAEKAPEPRAAPPDNADPAAGWAVQVGSFSSQSNAQRLAEQLDSLDYKAFVSRKVVNDRVMYRVRVGPLRTRDAAAGLALRLKADKQPASIVEHPG